MSGCSQDVSGVFPGAADGSPVSSSAAAADTAAQYRAAAELLRSQGITDVDGAAAQSFLAGAAGEAGAAAWAADDPQFCLCSLLGAIGWGEWDENTGVWTPTSSQVYVFDTEVADLEQMYAQCLSGIGAIAPEVPITAISEDTSQVDWETGTGRRTVGFTCGGRTYTYGARENNDWFDTGFLACAGAALARAGGEKRLFAASDGGQCVLLFYNTPAWAQSFSAATGLTLERTDLSGFADSLFPEAVFAA